MGLLDDAIREHLELKRRQGADPGEIARAEYEALEPIFPEESVGADQEPEPAEAATPAVEPHAAGVDPGPAEKQVSETKGGADFASVGQETAELDMQAVLDADAEHPAGASDPVRGASSRPTARASSAEPDLGESTDRQTVPEQVPGQERLSFE